MWLAIWPTWLLVCFHFDHRLAFSRIPFPCFLPGPHSVSRSRPPRRHRIFPTRHSAHQQMSQSLTTQSNRTHRPYRTQVLLIREILIVSCVLSLLLVMASLQSAAQQAPTLGPNFLPVKLPFALQNEQFSTLQNSMADRQRQLRELTIITARTREWMRSFETHSNDIDKALDSLRERLDAMQSASLWPLPKIAGSTSSSSTRCPSQNQTPREAGISQLPGKRQKRSFSPAQESPEGWYQQDEEFLRSAVLVRVPCGQNKDTVKTFATFPSLAWRIPTKSSARRAVTMPRLVFQSKACQLFLAANSGKGFLYTACRQKSSFEKESCWPLFGLRPNRLFCDRFNQTPGIEVAPVVAGRMPECVA